MSPSFSHKKLLKQFVEQFVAHIEDKVRSENSQTYHGGVRGSETAEEEVHRDPDDIEGSGQRQS